MATSLRAPGAETTKSDAGRVALVLNEKAGAVLAGAATPETMRARLEAAGFDSVEPPAGPLPARLRAAASAAACVVVAGGDGTMACAAAALADTHVTLGLLPCGTMNLLARDLGVPADDLDAALDVIVAGHTRSIDVGDAGGHTFLCACMMGGPVRLGRHREQARRHGRFGQWLQFARAAVMVLRRPRHMQANLTVDGIAYRLRTRSLTITLGALTDDTGRMFGRAALDEGVLCAYVIKSQGVFALLRVFWRLAHGRPRDPALTVLRGKHISISAKPGTLHVMVDGEVEMLPSPVHFSVRPRALQVLAP